MLLRVLGALLLCLMCGVNRTKKLRILNASVDAPHIIKCSWLLVLPQDTKLCTDCVLVVHRSEQAMCDLWNFSVNAYSIENETKGHGLSSHALAKNL